MLGAVLLLAACSGKTTGTTNITSTSATLNSLGSCASGETCRWYWEYWATGSPRTTSTKTAGWRTGPRRSGYERADAGKPDRPDSSYPVPLGILWFRQ